MNWFAGLVARPLGGVGVWVLGIASAAALGVIGTQTWRLHSEQAAHAQDRAAAAERESVLAGRAVAAEQQARSKEQQRATDHKEITDAADKKIAEAVASAVADVSSRSLRDRAQAVAAAGRRTCTNPAPAVRSETAGDSLGVLADVLGRIDERAELLALEADKRRIRAVACEDAYEALRK